MSNVRIVLAMIAGLAMSPAWAQQGAKPAAAQARPAADPAAEAFKAWDKDASGNLSLVEFRAGWQQVQRVT